MGEYMSQGDNNRKVSKRLKEKRFLQKYTHTIDVPKYYTEIWNSDDVQFFAIWHEYSGHRTKLTQDSMMISLDLFAWKSYGHNRNKELSKQGTIRISPEQTAPLRDFLTNKPTDETFTLAWGRYGVFHLSFEKRGLFGQTELSWKFLFPKEDWDNTLFLPSKKRKEERKRMAEVEQRQRFWFADSQVDTLLFYLRDILP